MTIHDSRQEGSRGGKSNPFRLVRLLANVVAGGIVIAHPEFLIARSRHAASHFG